MHSIAHVMQGPVADDHIFLKGRTLCGDSAAICQGTALHNAEAMLQAFQILRDKTTLTIRLKGARTKYGTVLIQRSDM